MKTYGEMYVRVYASFLDVDTSWRLVASFTSRPLFSQEEEPQYSFNWKLDGPQNMSGRYRVVKILHDTGNRTPIPRS
jgi:hypothetical protein